MGTPFTHSHPSGRHQVYIPNGDYHDSRHSEYVRARSKVPAIRAYLQQRRATGELFDVTLILWSEGDRSAREQGERALRRGRGHGVD